MGMLFFKYFSLCIWDTDQEIASTGGWEFKFWQCDGGWSSMTLHLRGKKKKASNLQVQEKLVKFILKIYLMKFILSTY